MPSGQKKDLCLSYYLGWDGDACVAMSASMTMNQVRAVDRGCAKIFRRLWSTGSVILGFNFEFSGIES